MISLNPRENFNWLERSVQYILDFILTCLAFVFSFVKTLFKEFGSCVLGVTLTKVENDRNGSDAGKEEAKLQRDFAQRKAVQYLGGLLQCALAAAIPGLAVLGLYHLKSLDTRIYVLVGLGIGFAVAVKLLSFTRDVEIFGVTST